jgi:transcriptional regulator with XRE-family HTH domain
MGFGTDLRKLRKARGYTLRNFAKIANISPTYLSKLEHEEFPPCSAETIARMAELLEIDPDITCLKAGKIPHWIKNLLFTAPINCIKLLKQIKE